LTFLLDKTSVIIISLGNVIDLTTENIVSVTHNEIDIPAIEIPAIDSFAGISHGILGNHCLYL
jgi:hypothetical protein